MAVARISERPAEFQDVCGQGYEWYRLSDEGEPYAVLGLALRGEGLELHLALTRWGKRVRRAIARDRAWLIEHARRLGARQIVGLRAAADGRLDPRFPKFAALYGFSRHYLLQAVVLDLDEALQPRQAVLG